MSSVVARLQAALFFVCGAALYVVMYVASALVVSAALTGAAVLIVPVATMYFCMHTMCEKISGLGAEYRKLKTSVDSR